MTHFPFTQDKSVVFWFSLVAAVYLFGYGWLLIYSDFLPYVLDNNETFSSIVHAGNMYHFGLDKTFGLTDEAYGMSAAAHPYVYTHQGNFPRLFALLLYALGAQSAESQIVITTFTVGFLGIGFAFYYFSRTINPAFSAIFCLLMMTDYVMFAQWQVNTWQVWHVFFFFLSLLCVVKLGEGNLAAWVPISIINFCCLLYYEILFSAFVLTFCGLYAIYIYRKRFSALAAAWAALVTGPAIGGSILVAQNVAFFGWDKFLLDLRLTYFGRNMTSSDQEFIQKLTAFYDENNIVFWHNITDASYLRSPLAMAKHLFEYALLPYTPLLILMSFAVSFAWLIARNRAPYKSGNYDRPLPTEVHLGGSHGPLLLAGAFTTFASAVFIDSSVIGAKLSDVGGLGLTGKLVVLGLLFFLAKRAYGYIFKSHAPLSTRRIIQTILFLLIVAAFIRVHNKLYDSLFSPVWREMADILGSLPMIELATVYIIWVASRRILIADHHFLPEPAKGELDSIIPHLIFGIVSYAAVAFLIPGYLKTVYLNRYAPLTIFFHLLPLTLLIYLLGCLAKEASGKIVSPGQDIGRRILSWGKSAIPLSLMVFVLVYWGNLQWLYFKRLPPDHFAFIKTLQSPPFNGASFVVNTYAAPVAVATGTWAYFDNTLGNGNTRITNSGIDIVRNLDLLWFADKKTNPAYVRPKYFLCIRSQYFPLSAIRSPYSVTPPPANGCSKLPLVSGGRTKSIDGFNNKIVAEDRSGRDRWAIVEMDWDYPPYLKRLDPAGRTVDAKSVHEERGRSGMKPRVGFRVRYLFGQKENKPEVGSLFLLYAAHDRPGKCARPEDVKLIATSNRIEELVLAIDYRGIARIGVTPRTETKSGYKYNSDLLSIGNRQVACVP